MKTHRGELLHTCVLPCLTYGARALTILQSERERLDTAWVSMVCPAVKFKDAERYKHLPGPIRAIGRRREVFARIEKKTDGGCDMLSPSIAYFRAKCSVAEMCAVASYRTCTSC